MKLKKKTKFLADGLTLALSSVFLRTVGVGWNAYLSGTVGAEGMGLLSLIMSVYGFAVTFASSGVGLGVTRTVSDALGRGDERGSRRALLTASGYAAAFGVTACVILFFAAPWIGKNCLCDGRVVRCVRLLGVSLPAIALSSVFGGYFNAVRRVWKSAVSAILEQGIRMTACVCLLTLLLPKGAEGACLAVIGGGVIAECGSCLFSGILCLFDIRRQTASSRKEYEKTSDGSWKKQRRLPDRSELRTLSAISLPIAISTYLRSALTTIEHILIPRCLEKNGATHTAALASYGMLGSMVLPVILWPASLTSAFASLLVPEMAKAKARKDPSYIRRAADRAIAMTMNFSLLVSVLMICYSRQIGRVLYDSPEAGKYLRVLAPIIPIMYLDTVVDSMLKGLGYQVYTMLVNIADAAISVLMVTLLIPRYGIMGYAILICVSEIGNASASLWKLSDTVSLTLSPINEVLCPAFFSILSCLLCRGIYTKILYLSPESPIGLCVHIVTSALVYAILIGITERIPRHSKTKADARPVR